MQPLDKEKARKILLEEYHLSPVNTELVLRNFPLLKEPLTTAVEQWFENRTIADVEIDGLSIKDVMQLRNCHFLIAIKDLSRLQDPSLPTEKRKRLREILSKPVIIQ